MSVGQLNGFNEYASNAIQQSQLYKHPLIMMYASVHLSAIITSILSPSDTSLLPSSPPSPLSREGLTAPSSTTFQPGIAHLHDRNEDLWLCRPHTDGETDCARLGPGCVFSVSRVINFPLWSPLGEGPSHWGGSYWISLTLVCHHCSSPSSHHIEIILQYFNRYTKISRPSNDPAVVE